MYVGCRSVGPVVLDLSCPKDSIFPKSQSHKLSGLGDFPGGPVAKTPFFHCRGNGFDPWLENNDPTCGVVTPRKLRNK